MNKTIKEQENYKKGIAAFKRRYSAEHINIIDHLYELSPEFADVVVGHGLYDIWEVKTKNLTLREKEIATLASLGS
jgi:alkylhydroperoxidase/carboxymuconolactone decarboxylase family protein YurZ